MIGFDDDNGITFLKGTHYIERTPQNHPRSNPVIVDKPFGVVETFPNARSMMYVDIHIAFYHFLIDGLTPMLEVFEKDKDCLFIIDFNYIVTETVWEFSYYLWTIDLFNKIGLKYEIRNLSKIKKLQVENCHIKNNYQIKKLSIDLLYKYALKYYLKYEETPKRKIYISRKKTTERSGDSFDGGRDRSTLLYDRDFRLYNEEEIELFLSNLGFEIVCMEDFTFNEQIKMMHEAKIIVGVSQSALLHSIFMKPGQTVLELSTIMITQGNQEYHDYWHGIAFSKGHNYISIPHDRQAQTIINNINSNKYLLELLSN